MGPKQPPAKKQKTDEARATILKYIITQNRPYNSTDVYNNLHSSIGKTLVGKILEKLAKDKEITAKAFGKTTIYFPNQNADDIPSAEETREIDVKIASLKEEASVLKAEVTKICFMICLEFTPLTLSSFFFFCILFLCW
ncbi:Tat binding protein 1-interacting protein-domain-containing protein [Obelidium mucronatum]|nr:Tat binding protein 1-interacting protein-domain-containing protein [Obelidium mucronatum]